MKKPINNVYILTIKALLLIFLISCSKRNYQGLRFVSDPKDFTNYDYTHYKDLPLVYKKILDDDLDSIKVLPHKIISTSCIINGEIYSPLIFACKHGRTAIAHYLIDQGANVKFRNRHGESALHFLSYSSCNDTLLVKRLFSPDLFRKMDSNGHTPLFYSVQSKNLILFCFLLKESNKSINWYGTQEMKSCFLYAGRDLLFLEPICNYINWDDLAFLNDRPIDIAIKDANLYNDATRLFEDESVRVKDDSFDVKMFALFMAHGMNINEKFEENRSILFKLYENNVLIKYLCDKVQNLNALDKRGQTFTEFYIDHCVLPDSILFNNKMTAITSLNRVYEKDLDVIGYLVSKGGNVNQPYKNAFTYLILKSIKEKNYYLLNDFKEVFLKSNDRELIYQDLKNYLTPEELDHFNSILQSN